MYAKRGHKYKRNLPLQPLDKAGAVRLELKKSSGPQTADVESDFDALQGRLRKSVEDEHHRSTGAFAVLS